MPSKELDQEIKKWNNLENLIEYKKFQYSRVFSQFFWLAGFLLTVTIVSMEMADIFRQNEIVLLAYLSWLAIISLAFPWAIITTTNRNNKAIKEIEYLYKKLDKQSSKV